MVTREVELLGGRKAMATQQQMTYQFTAEAKDAKGALARAVASVTSEPLGENIVLRLDKAIYRSGDTMHLETRSSAAVATVFFDVVKQGQTLLTKWIDCKDGAGYYKLDLPADLFGTLEVHAYQNLPSGEIIRDSRVVYVSPRSELKIDVKPDKEVHLPGEEGKIQSTSPTRRANRPPQRSVC